MAAGDGLNIVSESMVSSTELSKFLGQKSCRTKVPRIFRIFVPNFPRSFRASFRGKRRPEKNHQKSPPFFNAKFPGKHEENIHKMFLESRQSNKFCCPHRVLGRELSELLSAYYLYAKVSSPSFLENSSSLNIEFLGGMSHGHPGGYLGGRPGPKTFTPSLGAQ